MNPETAHSRIAGLDFLWDIEMAIEAGKLFHIHLNSPDGQRYDQDLPFGYTQSVLETSPSHSSAEPPLPSFVFTLAATGTTGRKS